MSIGFRWKYLLGDHAIYWDWEYNCQSRAKGLHVDIFLAIVIAYPSHCQHWSRAFWSDQEINPFSHHRSCRARFVTLKLPNPPSRKLWNIVPSHQRRVNTVGTKSGWAVLSRCSIESASVDMHGSESERVMGSRKENMDKKIEYPSIHLGKRQWVGWGNAQTSNSFKESRVDYPGSPLFRDSEARISSCSSTCELMVSSWYLRDYVGWYSW